MGTGHCSKAWRWVRYFLANTDECKFNFKICSCFCLARNLSDLYGARKRRKHPAEGKYILFLFPLLLLYTKSFERNYTIIYQLDFSLSGSHEESEETISVMDYRARRLERERAM